MHISCRSAALLVVFALALSSSAECRKVRKTHEVKPGDSIAKIADFYGVSQRDLLELNGLSKGRPLKVGQTLKIPAVLRVSGKKYKVKEGDSLASIGEKFKCKPRDIAHANKMSPDAPLKVGRTIVIPDSVGSSRTIKIEGEGPQPILFLRVYTGERERLQLYSRKGEINHQSVRRLSYMARDRRGKQQVKRLNFRLIRMLQKLAEAYPDKPIEIISGYRPGSDGNESQHAFGRAMDFRMPGVSTGALFRFCKTQKRAGCGFYPNGGFVHMDAREKSASWVERSKSQ